MKLTDEHIEILKTVRSIMWNEDKPVSQYICVNVRALVGGPWSNRFGENYPLYAELMSAIMGALYPYSSIYVYLRHNVPGFKGLPSQRRLAYMARLAWLDRMIETREIA
jgi:hypothetical protein